MMLCATRQSDGQKVFAFNSIKEDGPFQCPGCSSTLVIRKGRIKAHHFAHKPPFNCSRGEGETDAHRRCKESIYQNLLSSPNVSHVDIECDFGTVISDVFAIINGNPIAIEVQRSNLSVNEISRRTAEYNKLNINVIWIALFNDKLKDDKYSPKAWEKWCHATYYGRVYYWLHDLTIMPIHFDEYQLYVEESSWYESGGYERSAGGYYRSSKRYKTPVAGKHINLSEGFAPTQRSEWSGGSIYIPKCKIYLDQQKAWWK